jgi:hypothetical protein
VERVAAGDPPARVLARSLPQEFEGIVRQGKVELENGNLPDGTRVQVRIKK